MKELSEEQLDEISKDIIQGRKIDAIKAYREVTGLGLKESKDAIEAITRDLAKEHPEILENQPKGCAGVLVFGLLMAYAVTEFARTWTVG